jgi:polar amino acid transport system substrate-binding protein
LSNPNPAGDAAPRAALIEVSLAGMNAVRHAPWGSAIYDASSPLLNRRRLAAGFGAAIVAAGVPAVAQTPPESTFDRIRRTGVLRLSVLPGEMPFFRKDLTTGTWSGAAMKMAESIAAALGARLEYVEGTYATSVLDLQANKSDLAFALQPTPARALAIGFTRPYYMHPTGCVSRASFQARTWDDLNRPEVRIVSLIGSSLDPVLRRYTPKAQIVGARNGDDAVLLMQAGRGDCIVYGLIQALGVSAKLPDFSRVVVVRDPIVALPSGMGVQEEPDRRFRDFLDSWVDFNNGTRVIAGWIRDGLLEMGVKPEAIPADAGL